MNMPMYAVVVCPSCNEGVMFNYTPDLETTECRRCSHRFSIRERRILYKGESLTDARKALLKITLTKDVEKWDEKERHTLLHELQASNPAGVSYGSGSRVPGGKNETARCTSVIIQMLSRKKTIPDEELIVLLKSIGFSEKVILKSLQKLEEEGEIYSPRPGTYSLTRQPSPKP